jgi:protein-disulfide isomerase
MTIARHILAALIVFGAGSAIAQPADKARIEQAYAARLEVERRADIDQRIAARWPALAQDPALPVIGSGPNNSAGADVTIVEFSDYNCPYCKAMEPRLAALLKADRKVKLVMMEFPILTPASMTGTRAALAAMNQGKYAAFHQALMRFEGNVTDADVFDVAKSVGLDMARLKKDMQSPQISDRIIANYNLARGIRVVQTPAVIVGGPAGVHIMGSESAAIDFPKAVAAARRR